MQYRALEQGSVLTGLRGTEKRLKGNQCRANRQSWSPLVLEDIEADGASLRANVRVPDLGIELHL